MSFAELKCHRMTAANFDPSILQDIVELHRDIWMRRCPNRYWRELHLDLWHWTVATRQQGSIFLYLTLPSSQHPLRPIGYLFASKETHPEINKSLLHVEPMGMSLEAQQREGIHLLINEVIDCARADGEKEMTIMVYEEKWNALYEHLRQNGWEVVARRESDQVLVQFVFWC